MMNDEILLLKTLNDLYKSINSNDEYEVLRASALIRQLFLDGSNSLFDRVNRKHRTKLEFEIAEFDEVSKFPLKPMLRASIQELDPKNSPSHWTRKKLSRDKFFAFIVANIEGHEYSIKELIRFAAHNMGGVHLGDSNDNKEKHLEKLRGLYIFSNINIALQFVKAVGRNVLESLIPLRNKILSLERFENATGITILFAIVYLVCNLKVIEQS